MFWGCGTLQSGLSAIQGTQTSPGTPRVYDSYCFSYENEGIYDFQPNLLNYKIIGPVALSPNIHGYSPPYYPAGLGQWPPGTSTNGLDDDGNGIVDDVSECITLPPYPVALRGIQVKIRCFEPDSRQIREITIEQDFLPK